MILSKTKRSSLVQDIVDQIEKTIIDGRFKGGEKIASVRKLEKMLGVSSGTLREALRILQQKGLIEVKLGTKGGIFAKDPSTDSVREGLALLIRQRRISIGDLAEFRKVVEPGLFHQVVKNLTKSDIQALNQYLIKLKEHTEKGAAGWKGFLATEVDLRKALIKIGGNLIYESVLVPIHENIFAYGYLVSGKDANVEQAYTDWSEIIQALEKRDAEKAGKIAIEHIARYAKKIEKIKGKGNFTKPS
jgi:DNA-binding FadR family transcriptional regulator